MIDKRTQNSIKGIESFLKAAEEWMYLEECGLAWRFYDINNDEFYLRFKEKRWVWPSRHYNPETDEFRGETKLPAPPYFIAFDTICCVVDKVDLTPCADGPLISDEYPVAKSRLKDAEAKL